MISLTTAMTVELAKLGQNDLSSVNTIRIFAGAPPADASAAETGELLCVVRDVVMAYNAPQKTLVLKEPARIKIEVVKAGRQSHFRLVTENDSGSDSQNEPRIQSEIEVGNFDLTCFTRPGFSAAAEIGSAM